jgi:hypothetical protein
MQDPIAAIAERLRSSGVPFAVIGAAAMSARGFPRQTLDFDLLTTERRVLDASFWSGLPEAAPDVRHGDADDPLAGVVRFTAPEVDLIVGRYRWQAAALERAEELSVGGGRRLPVVTLADLILSKLFAGGYRDAADVRMMLAGAEASTVEEVDRAVPVLPADSRRLWKEILSDRRRSSVDD